mmetsp:Transcript_42233/g.82628  ORF Transcript_42233/g.82628 Transcript_42233/m.82628 type:complete len:349 (+) Transcript_42233:1311-2357(+)
MPALSLADHTQRPSPPVLILALDPGRNVSFVAVRVTSPSRDGFRVAAFGKIPVTFSHGAQPSSPEQVISLTEHEESSWSSSSSTNPLLLRAIPDPQAASDAISAPWHKESSWSSSDSAGSLFELVSEHKRLGDGVLVVLEAQRGYLREHLSDPLQALMRTIGWDFCLMPPSERLHRLGVTSDKASVVRTQSSLGSSIPSLSAAISAPSGCEVASHIASVYSRSISSDKLGANASRIASCAATVAKSLLNVWVDAGSGANRSSTSLTRNNLRNMRVCSSEASDLCIFFRSLLKWAKGSNGQLAFVELNHPNHGSVRLWAGKQNRVVVQKGDLEAFFCIFVKKMAPAARG